MPCRTSQAPTARSISLLNRAGARIELSSPTDCLIQAVTACCRRHHRAVPRDYEEGYVCRSPRPGTEARSSAATLLERCRAAAAVVRRGRALRRDCALFPARSPSWRLIGGLVTITRCPASSPTTPPFRPRREQAAAVIFNATRFDRRARVSHRPLTGRRTAVAGIASRTVLHTHAHPRHHQRVGSTWIAQGVTTPTPRAGDRALRANGSSVEVQVRRTPCAVRGDEFVVWYVTRSPEHKRGWCGTAERGRRVSVRAPARSQSVACRSRRPARFRSTPQLRQLRAAATPGLSRQGGAARADDRRMPPRRRPGAVIARRFGERGWLGSSSHLLVALGPPEKRCSLRSPALRRFPLSIRAESRSRWVLGPTRAGGVGPARNKKCCRRHYIRSTRVVFLSRPQPALIFSDEAPNTDRLMV